MSKSFEFLSLLALILAAAGAVVVVGLLLRLRAERRALNRISAQIGDRLASLTAREQSVREQDRVRQRLLGAMSHDIRQPIQAMQLYLQRIDRAISVGWVPDSERAMLSQARSGLHHGLTYMTGLLDGVLDVSQLMQGSLAIRADAISLTRLLGRLVAEQATLFEERGGLLTLREGLNSPTWVKSDERLLERLLRNLLANALRYAPGCPVRIRVRCVGGVVKVVIADAGPGMEPARLAQLRRELQRTPTGEMDASLQGVGLGLVIARQIALRIGARLAVTSLRGRGTAFMLVLPAATDPGLLRALAAESEAQVDLEGEPGQSAWSGVAPALIVIVGSIPEARHALTVALVRENLEVLAYATAQQACTVLAEMGVRPSLLILDHQEGEADPLGLAEQFETDFNDWIPTLILTDEALRAPVRLSRDRWVRVLSRPFAPAALHRLVASAAQTQSLSRENRLGAADDTKRSE